MIGSADEFSRLRRSSDPDEYGRAAREEAAEEVWLEVISRYPDMREWVAHNKTVPLEILALLARDLDQRVRQAVAMKRKLSRQLFEQLALDSDATVRSTIAGNPNVPRDVLEALAADMDVFVAETAHAICERNAITVAPHS
ncbi:MAG: hypothetical protein C0481_02510 [Phenylobacterium sp.]|nr:hypothetical protein [Phenylobacterium sp.]